MTYAVVRLAREQLIEKAAKAMIQMDDEMYRLLSAGKRYELEQQASRALVVFDDQQKPDREQFCDQCGGPYSEEWLQAYGGHWDTCPNRRGFDEKQAEPTAEESAALEAVRRWTQSSGPGVRVLRVLLAMAERAVYQKGYDDAK